MSGVPTTTTPSRPPVAAVVAAVLLVVIGAVRATALFRLTATIPILPIMGLVAAVISLIVAYSLVRGRRGTGNLATVVLVLGFVQALVTGTDPDATTAMLGWIDAGLSVVGIVLLWLPSTRRYVGPRTVSPAYSSSR